MLRGRRRKPSEAPKKKRLNFKESTELAALPDKIDSVEQEREQVYASLADPSFLRDGVATASAKARLVALEAEIQRLTNRWEELETISSA